MSLDAGSHLGPYEILSHLGAGGMGVVYKARDTRLGREVAIKVLPPDKVADAERKRRFIQEARAASALNHPNIVTIYDIGSEDGSDFIVMEYIAGRSLDQVIPRLGMRLTAALEYAIPVADGLAKAHAAGIVHRDLKPGNILVADDGTVKLLDFGLAKLVEDTTAGDLVATQAMDGRPPLTEDGAILGTVAYMSPEQAEGKPIDARADIFSFGAVFYEMLTGQKAFQGDSRVARLAAILREEPKPVSELVPGLPREIERLISRCLRKDAAKRWQSMADLRTSLQEFKADSDSGVSRSATEAQPTQPRGRRGILITLASLVIVGAGLAAWFWRGPNTPPADEMLRAVPLTSFPGTERSPSFSPDGVQVAFSWDGKDQDNADIWVKRIGPDPPLRLTQNPAADGWPAWSPDGSSIAFVRETQPGRASVLLIPPLGGPERIVTEITGFPGVPGDGTPISWSPNGKLLAVPDRPDSQASGLWLVSPDTGERRRLTTAPANSLDGYPAFSPDGKVLVFSRGRGGNTGDLYLLTVGNDLAPLGEPRRLTEGNRNARYAAWMPDGRELVFSSGSSVNSLWRMAIAPGARPRRLTDAGGDFAMAISGRSNRLVFTRDTREMDIYRVELGERGGEAHGAVPLIASTQLDRFPRYSPDGTRIAFVSLRSGTWQLWVADSDGANPVQLTSYAQGDVNAPFWSEDGRQIAFSANIEGDYHLYAISTAGGRPRKLQTPAPFKWPPGFRALNVSPDGKLAYSFRMSSGSGQADGGNGPGVGIKRGGALLSVPVEGGDPRRIFGVDAPMGGFEVDRAGIYFLINGNPSKPWDMMFYRFPSGPITKVAGVERPAGYGFSISPDRRYLLYTKFISSGSDLMLVENFK